MTAIEKWKEGKSPQITAIAIILALSAPDVSEALAEMRKQADMQISQPPIAEWLKYYRNHREILDLLQSLFSSDSLQKVMAESLTENEPNLSSQETEELRKLYENPATLFFLKVWGPCNIYYKTNPTNLYRLARLGKISAFEKLLRLDNSVIFDKKLSELFHQHKGKANKAKYRKLLAAFHGKVTERNNPKHIKTLAAATISMISEQFGERLTKPEIRDLFDAIAKDRGQGLQDEDLPLALDTFDQSIRRETKKMKGKNKKPDKR